jgi:single-stranded-DNA-specific exonuclease
MRGIAEVEAAEHFLAPALSHLHSPYLMTGMKPAIDRIEAAIENKESILIYGDYDVDGTTAIVILKTAIELCGGMADVHVPHRIRDGYDMRRRRARCRSRHQADHQRIRAHVLCSGRDGGRLGVDLIVTDHHLPGPQGPSALSD